MEYIYYTKEAVIHDETGRVYTVYGIEARTANGEILTSFSNVFFDRQRAEGFVGLCNEMRLDIIHLYDALTDEIAR